MNDQNQMTQENKRPGFLTVLCILSFIAAGIGIIGNLLVGIGKGVVDASGASSKLDEAMNNSSLNMTAEGTAAMETVQAVFSWPYIMLLWY